MTTHSTRACGLTFPAGWGARTLRLWFWLPSVWACGLWSAAGRPCAAGNCSPTTGPHQLQAIPQQQQQQQLPPQLQWELPHLLHPAHQQQRCPHHLWQQQALLQLPIQLHPLRMPCSTQRAHKHPRGDPPQHLLRPSQQMQQQPSGRKQLHSLRTLLDWHQLHSLLQRRVRLQPPQSSHLMKLLGMGITVVQPVPHCPLLQPLILGAEQQVCRVVPAAQACLTVAHPKREQAQLTLLQGSKVPGTMAVMLNQHRRVQAQALKEQCSQASSGWIGRLLQAPVSRELPASGLSGPVMPGGRMKTRPRQAASTLAKAQL